MIGRVRLKEPILGVQMDEPMPTLLEVVLKYLANNLKIVCIDGIVIPNEICDR